VLPGYSDYDVQLRVNNYLTEGGVPVSVGNPDVRVYDVPISVSAGAVIDAYQVQVTYFHNYLFLSGLNSLFGGAFGSVPLRGISTMRIEAISGS
jgi:hypothetical protein